MLNFVQSYEVGLGIKFNPRACSGLKCFNVEMFEC